jgi:MFS family permease
MAHATPPEQRGRAAGWFQVGNLGGAGLGGGLGLMLAKGVSSEFALINIAVVLFACTAFLLLVPEAPRVPEDPSASAHHRPHWFARIIEVVKELWGMVRTRRGLVALVLVFLPCGAAAAGSLFSLQVAKDWGAGADLVAINNGWVAGIAAAAGCLVGGLMSDRFERLRMGRGFAYMISGAILAACAVAMALSPKGPVTYTIYTLAYQFAGGIAYGCFTGFVLDVIGKGAAATKYNLLASLSNMPITYMTSVLGWASTKYGTTNALFTDAGSEIAGIVLFLVVVAIVRPNKERLPDEPALPEAKVVD